MKKYRIEYSPMFKDADEREQEPLFVSKAEIKAGSDRSAGKKAHAFILRKNRDNKFENVREYCLVGLLRIDREATEERTTRLNLQRVLP